MGRACLLLLIGCASDPRATPPQKLAAYTGGCGASQCADPTLCYQFKGSAGVIFGSECTTNCTTDGDCVDAGVCVTFALATKFCLAPCTTSCPANTVCKPKFDGTHDVCFVQ